jgi:hypothetical protein
VSEEDPDAEQPLEEGPMVVASFLLTRPMLDRDPALDIF